MSSTLDVPRHAAPNAHDEVRELFQKIWRELHGRERAAPSSDLARSKVWLECNGELVDTEAVVAIGIREPVPGVELVRFLCPRCIHAHESLRFR
jgi:hypothetical protein